MAKLHFDPWQEFTLATSLNERADGKWAAFEVGVTVPRQNGKGSILEGRELAGLFLLDERLLIHSAHQFDTSLEAFRRLLMLIEDCPDFDRRVQRVSKSHGEEGIELKKNPVTGLRQRIRFRTRTKGGGRGFTGDLLVLDEDMILPESAHGALLPTLSARPNPQVWYTGSAVDQEEHEHGVVKARIRQRGLTGDDPSLFYAEWSADVQAWLEANGLHFDEDRGELSQLTLEMRHDDHAWAQANPGLGIRISTEHVDNEARSMSARKFGVERLNVGDWPDTGEDTGRVISVAEWRAIAELDRAQRISGTPTFAVDCDPDQTRASIAVAGQREDELFQFAMVAYERGTDWLIPRCKELKAQHPRARFVIDKRGPAAEKIEEMKRQKLRLIEASTEDYGRACAGFFSSVTGKRSRYPSPQGELDDALAGARKKALGDAWKWSRRDSTSADISPLVAATLALWGATQAKPRARFINLNDV